MSHKTKGTSEAWELEEIGHDENHVKLSSKEAHEALDKKLGMKAISIRLPVSLIDDFKMIAEYNDIGYQPLIRDLLHRFRNAEMKKMATTLYNKAKLEESLDKKEQAEPDSNDEVDIAV